MFITWNLATKEGDYSCKIYWRKGKYGNVYIENVEYFNKKEVKKVDKIPYFELKVVKVKKEEHIHVIHKIVSRMECDVYQCFDCGHIEYHPRDNIRINTNLSVKPKRKGNYINGENLDKIKFPVPCSYVDNEDNKRHIGMLNRYVKWYRLYNMKSKAKITL